MPDPPTIIAPRPRYALTGVASRVSHAAFRSRGLSLRLAGNVATTAAARLVVSARDARKLGTASRVLARGTVRLTANATKRVTFKPSGNLRLKRATVTATLEVTAGTTKLTKRVVLRR